MAVTETPPETVSAASETAPSAPRPQPTGLAAVLGSGDHKVIGRLYLASGLLFGTFVLVLGALFSDEAIAPKTLDVFTRDTVFQFFTLYRVGTVFLLALPLVIGIALAVVPLQVGARTVAFPRAAAASYWTWLTGAGLLLASYAMNGGPGGGRASGVDLWIVAMAVLTLSVLVAAISLATTVLALRAPGLTIARTPFYAWSVLVAAILWLVTLPVLFGLLVVMYVDHRHGGTSIGANAGLYARITWLLRNPQIYVVAIPVLGFAADVLTTTARARVTLRPAVLGGIGAFGVLSFGAFLATNDADAVKTPLYIGMSLLALLPILAVLAGAADTFRKGSFHLTAGFAYAVSALLALLLGVAAGALGSIPGLDVTGTIYDIGVSHAIVLAAVIGSIGGVHWWATKVLRQPAKEAPGLLAPVLLLLGTAAVVIPDLISGLAGDKGELAPDYTGGIKGLNVVVLIGVVVLVLGIVTALAALLPALSAADDVAADPWTGSTLEWLAPSPPPLGNFTADLPVVTSAEPLIDLREEA
ncbi:MAG: putative cytochrome c oxidase subunit [Acidimicrobiales bacterium]|nr:putative cytochrome c oxidase subunit [Acidimicrobiales bacterium]